MVFNYVAYLIGHPLLSQTEIVVIIIREIRQLFFKQSTITTRTNQLFVSESKIQCITPLTIATLVTYNCEDNNFNVNNYSMCSL